MTEPITVRSVSVTLKAQFAQYLAESAKVIAATKAMREEIAGLGGGKTAGDLDHTAAATRGLGKELEQTAAKGAGLTASQDKARQSTDGLGKSQDQAGKSTATFRGELDKLAKDSSAKFNRLTTGVGLFGAGLAGVAGAAAGLAYDFDKQMSAVGAAADATSGDLDRLRKAAIDAGQATAYSATEAAKAEEELSKACVSIQDILGGALNGTLALAAAGGVDLGDAATYAAQALNIFGLQGRDVAHIADVMAAGANSSATDVKQLAQSLAQGGLVAHSFGLSLEDTTGALAAFANAGLVGSDAGTSFKTMLQALANPSMESAVLMKQLGINVYDAQGQFIGITQLAEVLREKLGTLTQAQRNQALAQIFGSDATRAANVLYEQGAAGLQKYINGVNKAGAAADAAAARQDNLAGDVEKLKGSLESLALSSGGAVTDGLRGLTSAVNRAVDQFALMPPVVTKYGTALSGAAGATLLVGSGALKARDKVRQFQEALTDMGPAGQKAATALGRVATAVGLVSAALVASQAAAAALGSDVNPKIETTIKALNEFTASGAKTDEVVKHLQYDLATLGTGGLAKAGNAVAGFAEAISGLGSVFDESLYHARQRIAAIDEALAAMVAAGQTDQAAKDFEALAEEAKKAGISVSDLKKGLPQYEAAINGASATQKKAIKVTEDAKTAFIALKGSLQDAIDRYGTFKDVVDSINGAQVSAVRATLKAQKAIDDFAASLKKNGKNFNDSTEGGRENIETLLDLVDAAKDAAEAVYEQTGSAADAKRVFDQYIETLRAMLHQLGLSDKAIDALINTFAAIPKNVTTDFTANGIQKAINDGQTLQRIYSDLNGKHVVTYVSEVRLGRSTNTPYAQRWGGVHYAAEGLLALDQAGIYVGGPVYGFAEPQTGGEAFVPRYGDYNRSMGILQEAARWYGAAVTPAGRGWDGAAGGGEVHYHYETTVQPKYVTLGANEYRAIQQGNEVRARTGRPR